VGSRAGERLGDACEGEEGRDGARPKKVWGGMYRITGWGSRSSSRGTLPLGFQLAPISGLGPVGRTSDSVVLG
jgi:hypothetical protein